MLLNLDGPATYGALSVTPTPSEVKVEASALEERRVITIQPVDGAVWFGYNSSVTSSTGTKIYKGQIYALEATDNLTVYVVADSGTVDVRITEVS